MLESTVFRGQMHFGESLHGVLAAARTGSDWAWHSIYRDLAPPVLGYLRANGAPEPEDLLGEVFLQMVRDLPRFEGGEVQLRAWVFTIAHRRLIDDRRRRTRRPVESDPSVGHDVVGGDVEEEALEQIGQERVRRELERLSADQRTVLLLRLFGDLTVEQVADATGKKPGAVKALQRRALAVLRQGISRLTVTF